MKSIYASSTLGYGLIWKFPVSGFIVNFSDMHYHGRPDVKIDTPRITSRVVPLHNLPILQIHTNICYQIGRTDMDTDVHSRLHQLV